jgi:hypothetical protein
LVRAHLAAVKLLVSGNDAVDDGGISEIIAALSTSLSYPSPDDAWSGSRPGDDDSRPTASTSQSTAGADGWH